MIFGGLSAGKEWYEAFLLTLRAAEGAVVVLCSRMPLVQVALVLALQAISLLVLKKHEPRKDARANGLEIVLVWCTVVQLALGLLAYAGVPGWLVTLATFATFAFQARVVWRFRRFIVEETRADMGIAKVADR